MRSPWMRTPWDVPQTHGELFEQKGGDATCHPIKHTQTHQDGSNAALTFNPKGAADICRNRHRGNAESGAAFQSIKDRLTEQQNRVFKVICDTGGATTDEIALALGLTPNEVSPRISELHFKLHKIEKIGTRLTRRNHPAAIWKAA